MVYKIPIVLLIIFSLGTLLFPQWKRTWWYTQGNTVIDMKTDFDRHPIWQETDGIPDYQYLKENRINVPRIIGDQVMSWWALLFLIWRYLCDVKHFTLRKLFTGTKSRQ